MTPPEILTDIHALKEELLDFERKYGLRSEVFHAAYATGEEPQDESWVLDYSEWASVYRTWLAAKLRIATKSGVCSTTTRASKGWPPPSGGDPIWMGSSRLGSMPPPPPEAPS